MNYKYIERRYGLKFSGGERVTHRVATNLAGTVQKPDHQGGNHYLMVLADGHTDPTPWHPQETIITPE